MTLHIHSVELNEKMATSVRIVIETRIWKEMTVAYYEVLLLTEGKAKTKIYKKSLQYIYHCKRNINLLSFMRCCHTYLWLNPSHRACLKKAYELQQNQKSLCILFKTKVHNSVVSLLNEPNAHYHSRMNDRLIAPTYFSVNNVHMWRVLGI
jgi:hypothetical protein